MKEENPPEFKFNSDDQDPDMLYQEELKELRVEKLSQRITLIAILLPCLLGVILYFGYRDLTGRVSKSQDSGSLEIQRLSSEVETLSKQFNDKLINFSTTLSTQDKDFETTLSEKISAINKSNDALKKTIDSLQGDLTQTVNATKKLDASKADKKSQEADIAKITAALTPLQNEVKALAPIRNDMNMVSSEIKTLTTQLSEILANTAQSRKDYDQLQTTIAALSREKIDKDLLDLELLKLRKSHEQLISQAIADLNKKLNSIQKEIDDIEKISKLNQQPSKATSSTSTPPKSATAAPTGADVKTTPSKSGTIVEQDIPE